MAGYYTKVVDGAERIVVADAAAYRAYYGVKPGEWDPCAEHNTDGVLLAWEVGDAPKPTRKPILRPGTKPAPPAPAADETDYLELLEQLGNPL